MQQVEKIFAHPQMQQAFSLIQEDREHTIDQQVELVQIPAPSNFEKEKALRFAQMLREIDLAPVVVDDVYNVYTIIKGTVGRPKVVLAAHLDTVFSQGTDLTVQYKEDGKICAPGINDDTRGVVELLSIARAFKATGIRPVGDIVLCANVGEESLGNLRGTRNLFKTMPDIDAFVSIDGQHEGALTYCATGSFKYKVTYRACGGHSFTKFGLPNPAHALGRAIAMLADVVPPSDPKTTFNVGVLTGGTSVNSIPVEAGALIDIRSNGYQQLLDIQKQLEEILHKAAQLENDRWNTEEKVTLHIEIIGDRPAGQQPIESTIVQASIAALRALGIEPQFLANGAGSTDCNWPISLGIPAVAIGRGGIGGLTHTPAEWFDPKDDYKGPQKAMLLVLALAGMDGVTDPVMPVRE